MIRSVLNLKIPVILGLTLLTLAPAHADFLECFRNRVAPPIQPPHAAVPLTTSQEVLNYAVQNNIPAFLKESGWGGGNDIPVLLVNRSTANKLTPLFNQSMGTETQMQPRYNNDHGMLRVADNIIDLDRPGGRGFGEKNGNGISWKNVPQYLPRRNAGHDVIMEVLYSLNSKEMETAQYYQRMRRASIVEARFTFTNDNRARAGNLFRGGGEDCFVFSKGTAISAHINEMQSDLMNMGVRVSPDFMNSPNVSNFLRSVRRKILETDPNSNLMTKDRIITQDDLNSLRGALPPNLDNNQVKKAAAYIVGLDASQEYSTLLRTLRVSYNETVRDMANPRATAVLVYDEKNDTPAKFTNATYTAAGKTFQWDARNQRPVQP